MVTFLTTVAMVSVRAKADITSYQQVWEHFSQLLDRQDGWVVSVPVASLSGKEKAAERRKRWRERGVGGGEEMRGVREGMEEGDMHLLIHVHIHIEDFGDKTHSHSIV